MSVFIHFLNGVDLSTQNHYYEKEYRNDVIIEIENFFYEVYFFTEAALNYEMRNDGFFSLPGIIILDEISNDKIFNAVDKLVDLKYFDAFKGKDRSILNSRFLHTWYENNLSSFPGGNMQSYMLG